jgi:molecular chaperone GrpE (heat shock protein)
VNDDADELIREALDKIENLIDFFCEVPLTKKLVDIRDDLNRALEIEQVGDR